jgi:hypothetical protein
VRKKAGVIRNQKGAMAVLIVALVSIVIVSTLSTVYMYLVNRTKYQARIRQAYIMTQVMEDFGRMLRQARDTAISSGLTSATPAPPAGACPGGVDAVMTAGVPVCLNACPATLPPGAVCSLSGSNTVGFPCLQHMGRWYCLEGSLTVSSMDGYLQFGEFAIRQPEIEKPGILEIIASQMALPQAIADFTSDSHSLADIEEMCRYSPSLSYCAQTSTSQIGATSPSMSQQSSGGLNLPVLDGGGAGGGGVGSGSGSGSLVGGSPSQNTPANSPGASPTQSEFRLDSPNCTLNPSHPNCQTCGSQCAKISYCFNGQGNCETGGGLMVQAVKLE